MHPAPRSPARSFTASVNLTIESEHFMSLYTKNGKPLHISNNIVYSKSGDPVGKLRGARVHDIDGAYVGTVVGDRLVHRAGHAASKAAPFSGARRVKGGSSGAGRAILAGKEPDIAAA
ncbi:MAG: hypothetical protein GAK35_03674 [Herbaspirillum frisingense]|uniref:Uncharacterized protein n=1 Tax=Herbaspirillum frisingense TaxID=92645 RepID=A0A7V8FTV0_9BURK|nr:MAG: hypothetical protein GAK35_03674 [Herbaspirillum frisingense]